MKLIFLFLLLIAVGFCSDRLGQNGGSIDSVYTSLSQTECTETPLDAETGLLYRGECAGVGGYKLIVLEGDLRQSLNLITADGTETALDLWNRITSPRPSYLGDKAEWRVTKDKGNLRPFALIVRFNAYNDPNKPERADSFLVVVKIDRVPCITNVIAPNTEDQNLVARKAADVSADKPCLESAEAATGSDQPSPDFPSLKAFLDSLTAEIPARGEYGFYALYDAYQAINPTEGLRR